MAELVALREKDLTPSLLLRQIAERELDIAVVIYRDTDGEWQTTWASTTDTIRTGDLAFAHLILGRDIMADTTE